MSGLVTVLEDFGTRSAIGPRDLPSEDVLETERLEAFDKGYRAGWDDAIKAKSDEADQASSILSQSLQELSFTYHEAQAQVLASLRPLLDEVMRKMLPAIAQNSLAAHVSEELMKIASEAADARIEIVVAPGAGEGLSELLEQASPTLSVSVSEAEAVLPGQAELRFGDREKAIDLAGVVSEINAAIETAFASETMAKHYG